MSKYIITLLTLIFVFFLVGSGCTVFQDKYSLTNDNSSNIISNKMNLLYSTEYVQKFFEMRSGNLASYMPNENYSAADIITRVNEDMGYSINPQVILVILELVSGIVESKATEKDLNNPIQLFGEEQNVDGFTNDIIILSERLGKNFQCRIQYHLGELSDCRGDLIIFKNGNSIPADSAINAETYAIHATLASLTTDKEKWKLWISKEQGSFYVLFTEWFGDPLFNTVKQ